MPSGKRETERKGNAPVNTGPSSNSDGRIDNTVRYCKAGKSNAFDNLPCLGIVLSLQDSRVNTLSILCCT
ncbi:Glutamate--tRNA ligase [Trichinella spiralis]|uniref:Glutamate--tRNA ligase n=1 Tax=Trichinella spiralis TaxID=6334 RepID=A0ABR3KK74_TRISP